MHMKMAKKKKEWPSFDLPEERGDITVSTVVSTPPDKRRDEMIQEWCASVWNAYSDSHEKVSKLLQEYLG